MRKLDTLNNACALLQGMIPKMGDTSATELFKTHFNGRIKPDLLECYGVSVRYTKDYKKLLRRLEEIRKSLTDK
jgi:hypothetical protein